jgi:hypothetical protein
MTGRCPKNLKSLKGGVSCVDAAGHTCFCSKYGCKCGIYYEANQDFKNFDAHVEWCTRYNQNGYANPKDQFCIDHTQSIDDPHGALGAGAKQAADSLTKGANSLGLNWDNLTYVGLAGLGLLVLMVLIR